MVEVSGNIDNLQSNIDFYLSITSKDEVLDSRYMRDRFFEIFQREDSYREENFLVYRDLVTEDYRVDCGVEPELDGNEELFDSNFNYYQISTIEVVDESETENDFSNWSYDEDESVVDITGVSYEDGVVEDEEDEFSNWGYDDDEEDEVVEESTIESDEDDFISQESNTSNDLDDDDFISWGDDSTDSSGEDEDDFISWGDGLSNSNKEVEDEFEPWVDDTSFASNIAEKQDGVSFKEFIKSSNKVVQKSRPKQDDVLDVFSGFIDDDDDDVLENIIIETPKAPKEKVITEVPKDLREFLELNPNCDLDIVYKYFSKKEVEKQLRLGRVFKRKGKLSI